MVVLPYIDCTNLNWYHKCPTNWFDPFGCHLHPVQLMYGPTANFKRSVHMYCGIAGNYGCTKRDWGHNRSMHRFNPFDGNVDPVQLMYGRAAYIKYFELAMIGPIHFVWESIKPCQYARTSTVRIWIDITNVPPTDLIHLAAICILYSWCTDVQPILNILK